MATKCEYEGCPRDAIGYVEAQWSIFDFLRYEMCFEHLFEAQADLAQREVEDCGHSYTAVRFYEPLIDWSLTSIDP